MKSTFTFCALLFWVAAVVVSVAPAQAQQDIYSPVILGAEVYSPGLPIQIREDGSGLREFAVSGEDFTHNGVKGQRYFIGRKYVRDLRYPDGTRYAYYDLVSYPEGGGSGTVLSSDASFLRNSPPRWSLDGTRVAYLGRQLINGGPGFNDCLVVADVSPAGGPPGALVNERCAINLTSAHAGESFGTTVSWAWDNLRLAYSSTWYTINPDLTKTPHGSLYVAEVPDDASAASRDMRVQLSDGDPPLGRPVFSPVDYDDRLLFARQRDTSANARADIWVATVPASYDPLTTVAPRQITNGGNTQTTYQLQGIDWSPDAQWLAFTAHPLSSTQGFQIYKIKADGSQRSTALTNSKKQGYGLTAWRR